MMFLFGWKNPCKNLKPYINTDNNYTKGLSPLTTCLHIIIYEQCLNLEEYTSAPSAASASLRFPDCIIDHAATGKRRDAEAAAEGAEIMNVQNISPPFPPLLPRFSVI